MVILLVSIIIIIVVMISGAAGIIVAIVMMINSTNKRMNYMNSNRNIAMFMKNIIVVLVIGILVKSVKYGGFLHIWT